MTKFLTEETPAKVIGLVGTAMVSMFFLFAVCVTNANLNRTESAFPDPFNPANVVAALDNASNGFSNFVAANLVEPAQNSYAVYQYNLAYVMDNATPSIIKYTGLTTLAELPQAADAPQVLGASTSQASGQSYSKSEGFSIDNLYSMLIR